MSRLSLSVVLMAACSLGGCASLGKPTLPAVGSAKAQQRRAVRFDPYLQNDIGPYALRMSLMDGSRPRDFNDPVAEVKRARWWAPVQ